MLQHILQRQIRRPRMMSMALLMVGLIAVIALPLWAQGGGGGAPSPELRRAPSPLIGYGIMALMFAAVIMVSLIPSKRGHQD